MVQLLRREDAPGLAHAPGERVRVGQLVLDLDLDVLHAILPGRVL
jgi:hypothetical protein